MLPIGKKGLSLKTTIDAAPDGAYEYSFDKKSGEYTYKLKKGSSDIKFDEYTFQLMGAANEKGDWTKLTDVMPELEVEWKVSPKEREVERKDAVWEENAISEENQEKEENVQSTEQNDVKESEEKIEEKIEEKAGDENKPPSIKNDIYTVLAGKPISIEPGMGSGDAVAEQVTSIRWKDSDMELLNISDEVVYKDGRILFSKEWVDKYIENKEKLPKSLLIVFDDANSTEVEITLK